MSSGRPIPTFGDRKTFTELRTRGRRARRGPVGVTFLARPGDVRVAFAVGRRAGGAVARNRIRRRLRAVTSVVLAHPGAAPGAYLLTADERAASLPFDELVERTTEAVAAATAPERAS